MDGREIGTVRLVNVEDEMRSSYLDYAMSVITARALPDVRDGLKPVQRRILFAMHEMGLRSTVAYRKSATAVGDVMGKYHPHGDAAIYDALVRMAQDFSMRYPLIDGQGNFGCFAGQTRVRLADGSSKIFEEIVADYARGEVHFTYAVNAAGRIEMAPIRAPRLTKKNAPVVQVTLDNGEEIVCTPDHRFMLRDGSYREAQNLQPDDSLMPLHSRLYDGADVNLRGYEQIHQPATDEWQFAHHLADAFNIKLGFQKGLERFFGGRIETAEEAARAHAGHLNHRVVSVEPAGYADVYDLTVDELHNFALAAGVFVHNSVDADPAAAMRYTEARMTALAEELLADIEKNTVDFTPNFDSSRQEPVVLPSKVPNLLLNGASGIAVGMATNVPPHNFGEIADGLIHLIDHPDATVEDLGRFIQGPDFPTAGLILGRDGIKSAYSTGHGRIVVQARAHVEEMARGGRFQIVVTELPYQVNKAALIEKVAELVKSKREGLDGITEIRDESDRQGMRIVVELRRDCQPRAVLNNLYKHTAMRQAFSANMLALVGGQPRVLTLKLALQHFLTFRREVIRRRTEFELARARERAHILEGLKTALDNLDAIIDTIRRSQSAETARTNLVRGFRLTEAQAQAILEMQLRRLAALERKKILDELAEVQKAIREYEDLLGHPEKIDGVVKQELRQLRAKFSDPRRTQIVDAGPAELTDEDLIPNQEVVVTVSSRGYVKRVPSDTYRSQRRGGKGITGMVTREADAVQHLVVANTHDGIMFFTHRGRVFQVKCHELPDASRQAKGIPLINIIAIDPQEQVTAVIPVQNFDQADYLVMGTRGGEVKKTAIDEFASVRSNGLIAMNLEAGDELGWAKRVSRGEEIIMVSSNGQAIRFSTADLRSASRASGGVRAMRLDPGAQVVGMVVVDPDAFLLVVSAHGYGKRTPLAEYSTQGRGGGGVRTLNVTEKTGPVVGARVVREEQEVMFISTSGMVTRTPVRTISVQGRATSGVSIMKVGEGGAVASLAAINGRQLDEPEPPAPKPGKAQPTTAAPRH